MYSLDWTTELGDLLLLKIISCPVIRLTYQQSCILQHIIAWGYNLSLQRYTFPGRFSTVNQTLLIKTLVAMASQN